MDDRNKQLRTLEADMAKLTRRRNGEPATLQLWRIFQLRKTIDDLRGAMEREAQPRRWRAS